MATLLGGFTITSGRMIESRFKIAAAGVNIRGIMK